MACLFIYLAFRWHVNEPHVTPEVLIEYYCYRAYILDFKKKRGREEEQHNS